MPSQSHFDLAAFLRSVPLFAELDDGCLAILARVCHTRTIQKGKYLFCQNDPADCAYIVYSGAVSILLSTPDGRELVINEMRPGDCFGELALLTGSTRSASAMARQASQLVIIPRDEFLREMQVEPALSRHLLETVSRRLYASTEREGAFAFLDAPARLARALLEMERAAAADGYITASQEEMAAHIGIARQTTAKILGNWRRRGWILTGRGKIVILDRNALKKAADG